LFQNDVLLKLNATVANSEKKKKEITVALLEAAA
jgi:hypothetical protein